LTVSIRIASSGDTDAGGDVVGRLTGVGDASAGEAEGDGDGGGDGEVDGALGLHPTTPMTNNSMNAWRSGRMERSSFVATLLRVNEYLYTMVDPARLSTLGRRGKVRIDGRVLLLRFARPHPNAVCPGHLLRSWNASAAEPSSDRENGYP
jgi:hypothetical protein